MSDIAKLMRNGNPCRSGPDLCKVRNAESGCECAMAADEIERLRAELERLTASNHNYIDRNIVFSKEIERLRRIIDPLFDDDEASHDPGCGIDATPCYPSGLCTCKHSATATLHATNERLRAALDAWACACRVDVTMDGPVFRGIERSAAAKAWNATLAALEASNG